jgi:hypothetical protein
MKIPLLLAAGRLRINPGENNTINITGMIIFKGRFLILTSLIERYKIRDTADNNNGFIIYRLNKENNFTNSYI